MRIYTGLPYISMLHPNTSYVSTRQPLHYTITPRVSPLPRSAQSAGRLVDFVARLTLVLNNPYTTNYLLHRVTWWCEVRQKPSRTSRYRIVFMGFFFKEMRKRTSFHSQRVMLCEGNLPKSLNLLTDQADIGFAQSLLRYISNYIVPNHNGQFANFTIPNIFRKHTILCLR